MIDSSGCYLGAAIRLFGAGVGKRPDVSGRCRPFVRDVKPVRVYWGDNALDAYWKGFLRGLVTWGGRRVWNALGRCFVFWECLFTFVSGAPENPWPPLRVILAMIFCSGSL